MKGSTGQNSEVSIECLWNAFEGRSCRAGEKMCLGKAVVEKFMVYIGWLEQEHKNIFFSNPNVCIAIWNFLFCNISNQKFCFINCFSGMYWILLILGDATCVFQSLVWDTMQMSRNCRVFINIFREDFVYNIFQPLTLAQRGLRSWEGTCGRVLQGK